MIDFDPAAHLTLSPAIGEETVFTRWVRPDQKLMALAFLKHQCPVNAMENAKSAALAPFVEVLKEIQEDITAHDYQVSRIWIGEPRRSGKNWSREDLFYPLRWSAHSMHPARKENVLNYLSWHADPPFNQSPLCDIVRPEDDPTTLMHEACELMRKGDYLHGLPLYEFRHQTPKGLSQWKNFLTMKHWDGRTFNYSGDYPTGTRPIRLLVHAEQGYGDTLQFARYLPWLNDLDADFMCYPSLIGLMKSLNFKGAISDKLDVDKEYDFHVPLCSLPLAMDPSMSELPRSPYLRSDGERYWRWREKVGREGYKVGICWAGNATHAENLSRTRTIEDVIKRCPAGSRLFNLQKGEAREQLKLLPCDVRVEDFTDELKDWSDTAALVDNLDLIVTVDTAVAHLAGALGRTVKLLTGPKAEWRWGEDSDRTRWYSSMVVDRT